MDGRAVYPRGQLPVTALPSVVEQIGRAAPESVKWSWLPWKAKGSCQNCSSSLQVLTEATARETVATLFSITNCSANNSSGEGGYAVGRAKSQEPGSETECGFLSR